VGRAAVEPQFPHGMRNTAAAYASFASTDMASYEDLPGHHLLAVRNLIATTNDESYYGSSSELPPPPATSHGYAKSDFSSVPDPVMFQQFLDAADYWFDCSNDSSARSYNPATSASWWSSMTRPTALTWRGSATERPPKTRRRAHPGTRGQRTSHHAYGRHEHQRAAGSSARARG
jgi:hypothetical protein